jgi:hypothetical protein
MLIVVTFAAIISAWVARERSHAHHERQIAEELQSNGATCWFGGPYDDHSVDYDKQAHWRNMLRDLLGSRVLEVYLLDANISNLTMLSDLDCMAGIWLGENQDLGTLPPAGLNNVEILYIHNDQLSGIPSLSSLPKLQVLTIIGKNISDISELSNLKELRELHLYSTRLDRMTPLTELVNLDSLDLTGMSVDDESIRELQEALPNCKIVQ